MAEEKSLKNELMASLKAKGLNIAEESLKLIVEELFDFISKAVIKSENKYDDLLLAVLPIAKPKIMELLDKIDGEEG